MAAWQARCRRDLIRWVVSVPIVGGFGFGAWTFHQAVVVDERLFWVVIFASVYGSYRWLRWSWEVWEL